MEVLPYINPDKIILMGLSRGGFVSALTAGQIPEKVAKDVQELTWLYAASKCADYTIAGEGYTGSPCQVHVINRGSGLIWNPTVETDSETLAFLLRVISTPSSERRPV